MRAPCLSSLLGIMLCCVVSPRLLADTKPTPTAEDAFRVVRAYADAMLEHGRDRYGEVHSPLFAAGLDRRSFTVFDKSPPNLRDIRSGDRTYNGANPMHDENLLQILYVLADLTGEPHYAQQADAAIAWFF